MCGVPVCRPNHEAKPIFFCEVPLRHQLQDDVISGISIACQNL